MRLNSFGTTTKLVKIKVAFIWDLAPDQFSHPVPDWFTCDSDPILGLCLFRVVPKPCKPNTIQANRSRVDTIQMEPTRFSLMDIFASTVFVCTMLDFDLPFYFVNLVDCGRVP